MMISINGEWFMKKTLSLALSMLSLVSFCYALDTDTHEAINEHISRSAFNGFSLDAYIKRNLGVQSGIEGKFDSHEVWWWIQKGGLYEDIPVFYLPYLRSFNHFHNPLTEEGFKGNCLGSSLCVSSTVWALMPLGTQSSITGNYSWHDLRDYYLKALTSTEATTRNTYFAKTFRGLGQLMHLIEDASVPAHTRNDAHLFGYHYEKAVENIRNSKDTQIKKVYEDAVLKPLNFNGIINNMTSFIDTNQYNNPNPDPNATANLTTDSNGNRYSIIGLSEYTQANFVSEGLFGTNFSNFPYPQITQNTPVETRNITNPLGTGTYPRQYYLKNCCGETNNGQGYLLAAVDLLDYWRQTYPLLSPLLPKIPVLDDNVYQDYASLLLPRAVGYSSGLLNYFFRGQ